MISLPNTCGLEFVCLQPLGYCIALFHCKINNAHRVIVATSFRQSYFLTGQQHAAAGKADYVFDASNENRRDFTDGGEAGRSLSESIGLVRARAGRRAA